jgi:hypothetical protein
MLKKLIFGLIISLLTLPVYAGSDKVESVYIYHYDWSDLENTCEFSLHVSTGGAWGGEVGSNWVNFYLFCSDIAAVCSGVPSSKPIDTNPSAKRAMVSFNIGELYCDGVPEGYEEADFTLEAIYDGNHYGHSISKSILTNFGKKSTWFINDKSASFHGPVELFGIVINVTGEEDYEGGTISTGRIYYIITRTESNSD